MAPILFSLYFGAVVDDQVQCSTPGVDFWYKHGRKVIGDKAKSLILSRSRNLYALYAIS